MPPDRSLTTDVPSIDVVCDDVHDAPSEHDLDATQDRAPGDALVRCTSNAACATHPAGRTCDVDTGRCVECVPLADTCPSGRHCDGASRMCVAGCRDDASCVSAADDGGVAKRARCDLASRACVECVTNEHCPIGTLCAGNVCVPGCADGRGCPTGQTCCAGACVDA